jgi:hypothetical protein
MADDSIIGGEWALVAGDARAETLQHDGATGEVRRTSKRPQSTQRWSSPKREKESDGSFNFWRAAVALVTEGGQ